MASGGAQAALKGYRLQALYTLFRILESDESFVFQLEGREDIDVLTAQGALVEIVQVKAYDTNLTLSALDPKKPQCFFRRALARRALYSGVRERLVSFGPFGPDMLQAWSTDGPERQQALSQLEEVGYTLTEASHLIEAVILDPASANELQETVCRRLSESLTGCDPQAAYELLFAWLFRAAEAKERITRRDLINRIAAVGKFIG
jgi:hypothetical protein